VGLRIIIGNGELHELDDDVLQGLLPLELGHELVPAPSFAVSHEIKEFDIILKAPACFAGLLVVFRILHFLQNVNLDKMPCNFILALVVAIEAEIARILLLCRVPDYSAYEFAPRAIDPEGA
jgi:hypothetical protein